MSMILDEAGYERMRAHQRASDRAAVSRADENEKLKERIKELEAELERWKPRPMSEAPKDGRHISVFQRDNIFLHQVNVLTLGWIDEAKTWFDTLAEEFLSKSECERLVSWLPIPTPDELKQIGGGK